MFDIRGYKYKEEMFPILQILWNFAVFLKSQISKYKEGNIQLAVALRLLFLKGVIICISPNTSELKSSFAYPKPRGPNYSI